MPAGMARASAISSPAPASSKVAGSRSTTRPIAGSPCRIDSPKSPRTAPLRKRTYCTATGSSKPMSWRNLAMSSAVASGGSSSAAGSPVRWRIRNTTTDTPKITSSDCQKRRSRYDFTRRCAPAGPPPRCAGCAGTCRPAAPTPAGSPRAPARPGRGPAWWDCTTRTRCGGRPG